MPPSDKNEPKKTKKQQRQMRAQAAATPPSSSSPVPAPVLASTSRERDLMSVEDPEKPWPDLDDLLVDASPVLTREAPMQRLRGSFDDELDIRPSSPVDASRRHRADSGNYRHPALTSVKPAAPVPPEWTPAWPSEYTPPPSSSRLVAPQHPRQQDLQEPMYAIRSASDVSVGSDGNAVVNQASLNAGELAVPRRITAADALGSFNIGTVGGTAESHGKGHNSNYIGAGREGVGAGMIPSRPSASPMADRAPNVAAVAPSPSFRRAQSGVYIHSLPSASEAEIQSSSSDSDEVTRFMTRPLEPPGHVAKPVPAPPSPKPSSTLDSMSQRIRRQTLSPRSSRAQYEPSSPSRSSDVAASPILQTIGTDTATNMDGLMWSRWEALHSRRLLILGYQTGAVQVWDVTELDRVYEVLHLSGTFSRTVLSAVVLPLPPTQPVSSSAAPRVDAFARARPLLAVLLGNAELDLYSLASHSLVKRVSVACGPSDRTVIDCSLQASESFLAITTLNSAHDVFVHIISAHDFALLHTIPLSPSSHLPTFSLSRRLLAVPLPPFTDSSARRRRAPTLQSGIDVLKDGASRAGSMKMEVATTARGVWGGVTAAASSALGGILSSSTSTASSPGRWPFSRSAPAPSLNDLPPSTGPAPTRYGDDRRLTAQASMTSLRSIPGANLLRWSPNADIENADISAEASKPQWVALYDLQPLLTGAQSAIDEFHAPILLAHFPYSLTSSSATSSTSPSILAAISSVSALSISPSGSLIAVADADGGTVKIFRVLSKGVVAWHESQQIPLPPTPRTPRSPSLSSSPNDLVSHTLHSRRRSSASSTGSRPAMSGAGGSDASGGSTTVGAGTSPSRTNVWHVYDLVRGMSRAKVESIVWAHDERWVGVGTAAGTMHMFATNPYGGPSDDSSHLDGRVRNVTEFQPLSTVLQSLARIHSHASRPPSPNAAARQSGPLFSFTFPPISTSLRSQTFRPKTPPASSHQPPFAVNRPKSPTTDFVDVLLSIPDAGRLELYRANVTPPPKSAESPALPTSDRSTPPRASPSKTSISLPTSGITQMMQVVRGNTPVGLKGRFKDLGSWDVRKDKGWEDVKDEFRHEKVVSRGGYDQDWLSEAELSTATTSSAMLPGSIYLSHQFSFHTFTDDWQALLHRGLLDLPSTELHVRKEVEANPIFQTSSSIRSGRRGDTTESFMQDTLLSSSPFEEPMMTAIQAQLDPGSVQQPMLPSYPNGLQIHPQSWRDATVPLRHAAVGLSEGVGGGIGRLRRELGKVAKSPRSGGIVRPQDSLTFDEHEAVSVQHDAPDGEALPDPNRLDVPAAHQGDSSTGSESTLSTANAAPDPTDNWDEWHEREVVEDVAEYERFETFGLGVVGEMDEDHHTPPPPPPPRQHHRQSSQPQTQALVEVEEDNVPPRPLPKDRLPPPPVSGRRRRPPGV